MADNKRPPSDNPISSEDLAAIIVDGLLAAGIVQKAEVPRAMEISIDKIEGRKQLGDY